MSAGRRRRGSGDESATFATWFMRHEMNASAGMGVAKERAQYHLCRAIAYLERGMLREALDNANAAAHLDEEVRPGALIVARVCIRREFGGRGT